jgi:hypothetical protein
MGSINCDFCLNAVYDEEYGDIVCQVDLDEDEIYRYSQSDYKTCPYFRFDDGDEYSLVRKQN